MTERSWWGWGTTDRALSDDECVAAAAGLSGLPERPRPVPGLADVALPGSRITPPAALSVTTNPAVRRRTPTARPTGTSSVPWPVT